MVDQQYASFAKQADARLAQQAERLVTGHSLAIVLYPVQEMPPSRISVSVNVCQVPEYLPSMDVFWTNYFSHVHAIKLTTTELAWEKVEASPKVWLITHTHAPFLLTLSHTVPRCPSTPTLSLTSLINGQRMGVSMV